MISILFFAFGVAATQRKAAVQSLAAGVGVGGAYTLGLRAFRCISTLKSPTELAKKLLSRSLFRLTKDLGVKAVDLVPGRFGYSLLKKVFITRLKPSIGQN